MAFPTVDHRLAAFSDVNGTSRAVSLPDGIATGDRVIVGFASDGDITVGWPAAWTELADFNSAAAQISLSVAYRDVDGTEGFDGTGDTITVTTSANERTTWAGYVIQSGTYDTGQAPEIQTAFLGGGGDTDLDPPSITASWGSDDNLFLAFAGHEDATTATAAPTNYTNHQTGVSSGNGRCSIESAERQLAAATDDPSAFTVSAAESWCTATVVIKPAGAGGVTGSAAITEPVDDAAGSGAVLVAGSAAISEPADAVSGSGGVLVAGTAAVAEPVDVVAGSGTVGDTVSGSAAITEPADTVSGVGAVLVSGTAAITEPPDVVAGVGGNLVVGSAAILEPVDTVSGAGTVLVSGTATILEPADLVSGLGGVLVSGSAGVTEPVDLFAALGSVFAAVVHPPGPATAPLGATGTSSLDTATARLDAELVTSGVSATAVNTGMSAAPITDSTGEAE